MGFREKFEGTLETVNVRFQNSIAGRYFKIEQRKTSLTQEFRAGCVSFLTVAYVLAVNPGIIVETGGICPTNGDCPLGPGSIGTEACDNCVAKTKTSLIGATAVSCLIGNVLMAFIGNVPFILGPSMGLNAYFTYTVVGYFGTGMVSYKEALAAVFIEGFIFIVISAIGVRTWLTTVVPPSIWLASSAGIGSFLAFIGLQASEGLGVVAADAATLVTLGGCTPHYRVYSYSFTDAELDTACTLSDGAAVRNSANSGWTPSSNFSCLSAGKMRSGQMWLGIFGGLIIAIMMAKRVRGALMIGILFVTFISWIPTPSNRAAYLGPHVRGGRDRMHYFKKVVAAPTTEMTAGKFDFSGFGSGHLWLALITFLYVDFLDATGTLYSMANFVGLYIPNFVDPKTRTFERQTLTFCVDGVAIVIGACLGSSPLTVFVESASGIREGGRTGLTSLFVAFGFFVSLFFAPLLASIPPYATGPALVIVGAMMVINIVKVEWDNVQEAVPAFITFIVMPLTYSIAYGVVGGILSWLALNLCVAVWNFVEFKIWGAPEGTPEGLTTWQTVKHMTFHPKKDIEPELDPMVHNEPFNDEIRDLRDARDAPEESVASVPGKDSPSADYLEENTHDESFTSTIKGDGK